jgi:hypothetical protein
VNGIKMTLDRNQQDYCESDNKPSNSKEFFDYQSSWALLHEIAHKIQSFTEGRALAQAVSRWIPTAAVRGSKPDLGMWDLWWDKVALGRFSRSTNYSTITLIYHPGKMYNRPMCGRSTGTYNNLGDLQRDLMGVKSHLTK